MKIESLRLSNFMSFRDAEMKDVPTFCVIVSANGTGKSTIFNIFGFLKDALTSNINTALMKLGGSRGFQEVRSRNSNGPIEIELKFREKPSSPLTTYCLQINERDGKAFVEREILKYRRGSRGQSQPFLNFSNGSGYAITNELDREDQTLKSNDILAVKGLAQFQRFPAVMALGDLIENCHLSDFHISKARPEQGAGYVDHLSRGGQVFVSTHSSDFLNTVELDEVFWLEKEGGYTKIKRASYDSQVTAYMNDGDKMGYLWKQGFFGEIDT